MSTKQSTQTVDNRPYWRQKLDYFRYGVVSDDPRISHFMPDLDPTPMTVTLRLPSMAERVAEFTRLGQPELQYDDDLEDDDFLDHLDDLPENGLSPHEDPSSVRTHPEPSKKATGGSSTLKATTLPETDLEPLPTSGKSVSEAPKEPSKP